MTPEEQTIRKLRAVIATHVIAYTELEKENKRLQARIERLSNHNSSLQSDAIHQQEIERLRNGGW